MSIAAINYAQRIRVGDFGAKLLFITIAENTFNDSGLCRVGQTVLMNSCEMSKSTLWRKLNVLQALGLIRVHVRPGSGSGRLTDAIELVGFLDWYTDSQPNEGGQGVNLNSRGQGFNSGGGKVSLLNPSYKESRTRTPYKVIQAYREGSTGEVVEEDTGRGAEAQTTDDEVPQ